MAKYKITKQQLVELKEKMINLPPLVKKALAGEPINTPDEAQQGILIYETPDAVKRSDDYLLAHWSSDDAIAFGFEHSKAYIGYNNELFFDSVKISDEIKSKLDKLKWQDVERMVVHAGVADFYNFLYGEDPMRYLSPHRSAFGYPGRLWVDKKIISFWQYPDKEKLPQLIKMLGKEIYNVYGVDINFSDYKIEIKQNEYIADLNDDDEDYEPDIDWNISQKIGNLIPIKDFISSNNASEEEMQAIHLLPSDEKKKTPQMQAARDADAERLGNKFNGNVSQAEWNNAKKKYQGEAKKIKITSSQLNEIKNYLLKENETTCQSLKLSNEIKEYIKQFETDEQLLRSGGLPIEMLDRLAFGFSSDDVKTLLPKQLKIKWRDDLENVIYEIKTSGLSPKQWASNINLSEPIEVSYEKNNFYIEDGHHRYYAARLLNKQLNIDLEIKMNPFKVISPELSYDHFHRCAFKEVKNGLNESVENNVTKLYHASRTPIDNITSYSDYKKEKSGYYEGMFFYDDLNQYQNYFNQQKYTKDKYYFYEIPVGNLNLYNLEDADKLKDEARKGGFPANNGSGYYESRYLDSIGYDGIKNRTEIILFHPEKFEFKLLSSPEMNEEITIPVTTGDTIMMGKFKNKKTVVKTIDKDTHGMPTINGKQATTFRTIKEEIKNDLVLYHGTKHNFLKFETTNIGGGEGNQSFGWGIYFTDNKYVSEFYANLLGGDNGIVYTINVSNGNFMSWYGKLENDFCNKLATNMLQNGITELPINRMLNNGKVEINKLPTKEAIEYYPNGKFLYENLALALGGDKMASNKLNELGVDGVYYPIGQFLKKGDKSHANGTNYVIFSEDKINIVKQEKVNNINELNENALLGEEFDPTNINFKFSKTEDNYSIRAFENDTLIGSIESEDISQDYYEYEFEDVWTEDELEEIFPEYNICKINYLTVNHEYQKSGVAKKLLTMLLDKKRKDGFKQFYLNASPMGFNGLNINSLVEFYKKFGFKSLLNQGNNVLMGISGGSMVTEATESDVNLSSFKPKKELNEKFWVNNKLKPIVRKRLLKIADDFIDFLKVDIKKVEDILLLGSLANYNWSSYSDVDLHLLVDFKTINKDVELVRDYFDSKRNLWNDEHDNLKIFGFPIEVYVQDKNDENASVGVF